MVEREERMEGTKFQVRYEGPLLADHTMDVRDLAPAMLALGDLIREANNEINEGRSKVKLLVNSDFEHGCFNINFELVQSFLEQVKTLIDDDNVKTAREVLEWIGIIGTSIGLPFLAYLKLRKGRPIQDVTELKDPDKTGIVEVRFEGDLNYVEVHQKVYNLGENPRAKRAVAGTLGPLDAEGIESMEAKEEGGTPTTIGKAEARDIKASCGDPDAEIEHEPQEVIAHLRVYGPVFDRSAPRWRFEYGQERIYADISETTIAKEAISRGSVSVGDTYKVRMTITEHETPKHQFRNEYKVLEVLKFVPAPRQTDIFLSASPDVDEDESDSEEGLKE